MLRVMNFCVRLKCLQSIDPAIINSGKVLLKDTAVKFFYTQPENNCDFEMSLRPINRGFGGAGFHSNVDYFFHSNWSRLMLDMQSGPFTL